MINRGSKRFLIVVMVLAALTLATAMPSNAANIRVTCAASGHINVAANGDAWDWNVDGIGLCLDTFQGPYQAILAGSGTSDSLGLCDGLLVQNLSVQVSIGLLNLRSNVFKVVHETWGLALTTFPVATPFLISNGGSGLGAMFTRVLLACPPAGISTATFAFNTST